MKKLNLVITVLCVLILTMGIVFAVEEDQGIEVTVEGTISVLITPTTIMFGDVPTDSVDNPAFEDVAFDASGSNVDVLVDVVSVTGVPFSSGLTFSGSDPTTMDFEMLCLAGDTCTYDIVTFLTELDVPLGSPAGPQVGIVTYMVTEAPPGP
jgi:hypothetical protein